MSSPDPLDQAREAALGHFSRMLLWVYLPGVLLLFASEWWDLMGQPLRLPMYVFIPAVGWLIRPSPKRPLALRGQIAIFGLVVITALTLIKAGPRNPSVALSIVMTFCVTALFEGARELIRWAVLLGLAAVVGIWLRSVGIVSIAVLPPLTVVDELVRLAIGMAGCVFVGSIFTSTLSIYRQSGEAERLANEARLAAERETQRLQREELVVTMARGMAHDLANVIQVVMSSFGLMRDSQNDEERRRVATAAEQVTARASTTLRALLAVGRVPSSCDEYTDIPALFTRLESLIGPVVGSRIQVSVVCRASGRVKMAQEQLEQVLLNLAFNARDAMPTGGTLTLLAELENDPLYVAPAARPWLRVTVSDTGRGIPEELLPRIFDPYVTTKAQAEGTGLGLAIVSRTIDDAGGIIDVQSRADVGTTFVLRVPLA